MKMLNLLPSEGVILEKEYIYHNGRRGRLYLTNKNIIFAVTNLFNKITDVIKIALSQIKIIDGEVQARYKYTNDTELHLYLKNTIEVFRFSGSSKKTVAKWIHAISKQLVGSESHDEQLQNPLAIPGVGTVVGVVKDTVGSIGTALGIKPGKTITTTCIACGAPLTGRTNQTVCCAYCDTEQIIKRRK